MDGVSKEMSKIPIKQLNGVEMNNHHKEINRTPIKQMDGVSKEMNGIPIKQINGLPKEMNGIPREMNGIQLKNLKETKKEIVEVVKPNLIESKNKIEEVKTITKDNGIFATHVINGFTNKTSNQANQKIFDQQNNIKFDILNANTSKKISSEENMNLNSLKIPVSGKNHSSLLFLDNLFKKEKNTNNSCQLVTELQRSLETTNLNKKQGNEFYGKLDNQKVNHFHFLN